MGAQVDMIPKEEWILIVKIFVIVKMEFFAGKLNKAKLL
jgi:hypothetical protein